MTNVTTPPAYWHPAVRGKAQGRTKRRDRDRETGRQAQKKEPGCQLVTSGLPEGRRLPTLPTGGSVPSAMAGLTALFGMGRGGSPPQWPPSITLGENQSGSDNTNTVATRSHSNSKSRLTLSLIPLWIVSYNSVTALLLTYSSLRKEVVRGISTGRLWHRCLYTSRLSTS